MREAIVAGVGIGPLPWFLASSELAPDASRASYPSTKRWGDGVRRLSACQAAASQGAAFCSHLLEHAPRIFSPS